MFVDKNWIQNNFAALNDRFFNGTLPTPVFVVNHSNRYLGQCSIHYKRNFFNRRVTPISYAITISNQRSRNEGDFLNTLLHEMIHLYFYSRGKMDVGHGREFQQMGRVFDKYGFNIQTHSELCSDIRPVIWNNKEERKKSSSRFRANVCWLTIIIAIVALIWEENALKVLIFFLKLAAEDTYHALCCL